MFDEFALKGHTKLNYLHDEEFPREGVYQKLSYTNKTKPACFNRVSKS